MSDGFSNPIIGGGGGLVYPSIHSPDFGLLTGWSINKDGSAVFNNVTIRLGGTLVAGNTLEINQFGWFLYAGAPAGPSAGGTFTKVGGLIQGQSFNSTTTAVNVSPVNVGDFIVLHVITNNGGNNPVPPTGVSGGNCSWQQIGNTFTGTNNSGFSGAVYLGTATATGPAVATVTYNGMVNSTGVAGQEYQSSNGQCTFVTQNTLDSAGTNTMPAITAAAGQLYSVFENDAVASVAGSTPGYTYDLDAFSNCLCFNQNCAAGVQAPVMGDSTCQFGIAVLLQAGTTPGTLILAGANAAGTDSVGNPFVEGLNVFQGQIAGASISAGDTVTIDSTGIKIYNGTPIPANLQLTISPTGAIKTTAPIVFAKRASTPGVDPGGGATAYTTTGGFMAVDGLDGVRYGTERHSQIMPAAGFNVTGTALTDTGLHMPVAARPYRVSGMLLIQAPAAAPGTVDLNFAGPGGATGNIAYSMVRAAVLNGTAIAAPNTAFTIGPSPLVANNEYIIYLDGVIIFTAAGTAALEAAVAAAATSYRVAGFSYVDFMPAD